MSDLLAPQDSATATPMPLRVLDLLARSGAVLALALPAVGAGVRLVSYGMAGLPVGLSVAADLPTLALAGLLAIWPGVVGLGGWLFLFYFTRRFGRDEPTSPKEAEASQETDGVRRFRWLWIVLIGLLVVVAAVLVVSVLLWFAATIWNSGFLYAIGVLVGIALGVSSVRRRIAAMKLTTSVIVLAVGLAIPSIVLSGLRPTPAWAVRVEFGEPYTANTGWYDMFGTASGFVYLRSCTGDSAVTATPLTAIQRFTYADRQGDQPTEVSLGEFTSGTPISFGFVTGCTAVPASPTP